MNAGIILLALAGISALTTLTVEAIKKLLDEQGKTYKPNLLAAIVAVSLSVFVIFGYIKSANSLSVITKSSSYRVKLITALAM